MPNIPSIKIGNTTYKVKDEVAREHLVEVSDTQPSSTDNRLWIKDAGNEYLVPTYEEFSNLNSVLDNVTPKEEMELTWSQGTIRSDNGATQSSSSKIRTDFYAAGDEDAVFKISPVNGFEFTGRLYGSKSVNGFEGIFPEGASWTASERVFVIPAGKYVRFVMRKSNDSNILPSESNNIIITKYKKSASSSELQNSAFSIDGVFVEQGGINSYGEEVPHAARIRTGFLKFTSPITIKARTGYKFTWQAWDDFKSLHSNSEVTTSTQIDDTQYYYRLNILKSNETDEILPDEFNKAFSNSFSDCICLVTQSKITDGLNGAYVAKEDKNKAILQIPSLYVEQGSINSSGEYVDSLAKIRTSYFQINKETTIVANDGYMFGLVSSLLDGTFVSVSYGLTTTTLSVKDRYYQLVVYKANNDVIVPSEINSAIIIDASACSFYLQQDITARAIMKVMDADNKLAGKRLSVMGDSISSFDGWIPAGYKKYYPSGDVNDYTKMYWGLLASEEGMIIDTINAFAGSTVGTKWQEESAGARIPFIDQERINNLGTPDVIIIFGGTNDYSGNPLGETYVNDGQYTNLYEFRTAYAYLLDQLKQTYPSSKILCLTIMDKFNTDYNVSNLYPIKQKQIRQASAPEGTPTHYMYEFNDSIRVIANHYGCSIVDITDCMNYYNTANDCVDGSNPSNHTHPKAIVHKRIKEKIKSVLQALL